MEERLNDIEPNESDESDESDESNEFNCSICLQEKIEDQQLCNTNCDHKYCKDCLNDWFNQGKNTCPMCRTVLKSYMNQNQMTKLITIESRRPATIDNVIINGRTGREIISDLINQNVKMRYILYMFGFTGIFLLTFYLGLKDNYEELLYNYHHCMDNYTDLIEQTQDVNNMLSDHKIVGIVYDSNHYKLCNIPQLYYDTCFGNV
tara:strand:+ start:53 stop:667 length:615 start_codon:yes stop_codon:yes gene_type:complete